MFYALFCQLALAYIISLLLYSQQHAYNHIKYTHKSFCCYPLSTNGCGIEYNTYNVRLQNGLVVDGCFVLVIIQFLAIQHFILGGKSFVSCIRCTGIDLIHSLLSLRLLNHTTHTHNSHMSRYYFMLSAVGQCCTNNSFTVACASDVKR